MAIGLENNPNNSAITVAYPYGGLKDNTGAGDGTPINKLTNDDIHQTLRKILELAAITPNGLPDNVTNGFQYITALNRLFKKFIGVFNSPSNATYTLTVANMGYMINIEGNTATKSFNLPNSNTLQDGDSFLFYNNTPYISIVQSGTDFVGGGADVTLVNQGNWVLLVLDKANFNWVIAAAYITPVPYVFTPHLVGDVGEPSFGSGWSSPTADLGFFKDADGFIHLKGSAQRTGGGGVATIFTLPAGFRPTSANKFFPVCVDDNGVRVIIRAVVSNLGNVSADIGLLSGVGDTLITFDSVSFYVGS